MVSAPSISGVEVPEECSLSLLHSMGGPPLVHWDQLVWGSSPSAAIRCMCEPGALLPGDSWLRSVLLREIAMCCAVDCSVGTARCRHRRGQESRTIPAESGSPTRLLLPTRGYKERVGALPDPGPRPSSRPGSPSASTSNAWWGLAVRPAEFECSPLVIERRKTWWRLWATWPTFAAPAQHTLLYLAIWNMNPPGSCFVGGN